VKYRNVEYSSLDMGLGEFSVHLLFWVLAHYRDAKEIFVLLDEPDAYLPPLTAERLLARLLEVARPKQWNLVIATHSESLIEIACENDSFVLLRSGETGIEAYDSAKHGVDIAAELISPRPLRSFMFCEDESAAALTRAILETERGWLLASTSVIWKDGHGYLRKLAEYLPRYKGMETSFAFVFDGDQRGLLEQPNHPESTWPSLCLPTSLDPDTLFRDLASDVPALAAALNQPELKVHAALDALQGTDEHDWVNGICARLGARTTVLNAMAQLWVANHRADSDKFLQDLRTLIG
jgi:energy-coupling factor transporter ATP-binding protein EcfA2